MSDRIRQKTAAEDRGDTISKWVDKGWNFEQKWDYDADKAKRRDDRRKARFAYETGIDPESKLPLNGRLGPPDRSYGRGGGGSGEFTPLTPGEYDNLERDYYNTAQVSSAGAEKRQHDAAQAAARTLEKYGAHLTPSQARHLQNVVQGGGVAPKEEGFMVIMGDVLSSFQRLAGVAFADATGLDDEANGAAGLFGLFGLGVAAFGEEKGAREEFTIADYRDAFTGNREGIQERHSAEFVKEWGFDGEEDYGITGQHVLSKAGFFEFGDEDENEGFWEKFGQTMAGFAFDVVYDPLTYVSFGTAGLGRKAALTAYTAGMVGSTARKSGWKYALQVLRSGGSVDDLTGYAAKAGRLIEGKIAKNIDDVTEELLQASAKSKAAGRVAVRTGNDVVLDVPASQRALARQAARKKIIDEELQIVTRVENAGLDSIDKLTDFFGGLPDFVDVTDSVFGKELSRVSKLVAEKKFKTLAKSERELIQWMDGNGFKWATGGLGITMPFMRRSMPILKANWTRLDGPMQKFYTGLLNKFPGGAKGLRAMNESFSNTRKLLNRAKAWDGSGVSAYFVDDAYTPGAIRWSKAGKAAESINDSAKVLNQAARRIAKGSGGKATAQEVNDWILKASTVGAEGIEGVMKDVPSEIAEAVGEQAAELRRILDSVHGAAEHAGWRLGDLGDGYLPLIGSEKFHRLITKMANEGTFYDELLELGAGDAETRLGLELIGEMAGKSGKAATAARAIADSDHAKTRILTRTFEAAEGTTALVDPSTLRELIEQAGLTSFDHQTLNRSVGKALDALADAGKLERHLAKAIQGEGAYVTNLGDLIGQYTESMLAAINIRQRIHVYRSANMMAPMGERISVTRTLKHVADAAASERHPIMRFLDDLADIVSEEGAGAVKRRVSAKTTVNIVKGWDLEVPAGVVDTEPFKKIVREIKRIYRQTDTHVAQVSAETQAQIYRMIDDGVPSEVAHRVATVQSHGDWKALREGLVALADEQATELMILADEQVARNLHKVGQKTAAAQLRAAAREADAMRAGVLDTIGQVDDEVARKLKVQVGETVVEAVEDVTEAAGPGGKRFTHWLADEADNITAPYTEGGWKDMRNLSPEDMAQVRQGANPAVAQRAAEDLVDRLANLTVDELVEFSGHEGAAVAMAALYERAVQAGLPVDVLDEIIDEDLLTAVAVWKEQALYLHQVKTGLADELVDIADAGDDILRELAQSVDGTIDDGVAQRALETARAATVKEAQKNVSASRQLVREAAEETFGSRGDVNIGAIVARMQDDILDVSEDLLFSNDFGEVWAAAMHRIGNGPDNISTIIGQNVEWTEMERIARRRAIAAGDPLANEARKALARDVADAVGEDTVSWKKLTRNSSKKVSRQAANDARALWHGAVEHAMAGRGFGELEEYAPLKLTRVIEMLRAGDMHGLRGYEHTLDEMMRMVMPSFKGRIEITPAGRMRLVFPKEEPVFATIDEFMPVMRDILGEGFEETPQNQVLGAIMDAFRETPEFFDDLDPALGQFLRGFDDAGGMDWIGESYEYLARFSDELAVTSAQLRTEARSLSSKAGHATRKAPKLEAAASALNDVVAVVDQALHGSGAAKKSLANVWEKNAGTIIEGMPNDVVTRARDLVEMAVGATELKMSKTSLNRMLQSQSQVWRPLSDAVQQANDLADDLAQEALDTGNRQLGTLVDDFRDLQQKLFDLQSKWGGKNGAPNPKGNLLGGEDAQEFAAELAEIKKLGEELGTKASSLKELAPDLFANGVKVPSDFASVESWAKNLVESARTWTPSKVDINTYENFVRVSEGGIVGNLFDGQVVDRQIAMVLENLAGGLHASNNPLLWKEVGKISRGLNNYWRSAVTVGRAVTFIPRNIIGGIYNGLLAGANMPHYAYTAKKILPGLRQIRKGHATWADLISAAKAKKDWRLATTLHALHRERVLDVSFVESQLDHVVAHAGPKKLLNPFSSQNAVFRGGGAAMEDSEYLLRTAVFVANFDPTIPATARSAREMVMATQFNYSDLSLIDHKIKRIAPFFTWTKNNIPLQARAMFERPSLFLKYQKLMRNFEQNFTEKEQEGVGFAGSPWKSGFAASMGLFDMGRGTDQWAHMFFDPDLPIGDFSDFIDAATFSDQASPLEWAIGNITPMLREPLEFSVDPGYKENAATGLEPFLRLFGQTDARGELLQIDPRLNDLYGLILPGAREWLELGGVVPGTPNAAAKLGYDTSQPIPFGERVRGAGLRALRGVGVGFDTPQDASNAANDIIYRDIKEIEQSAYDRGYIDPGDVTRVLGYDLQREGIDPELLDEILRDLEAQGYGAATGR